jgi:drug/metabolite transporter (DMT)-like permease
LPRTVLAVLVAGILAVSVASVLVRFAQRDAPSLAAAVLAPAAALRPGRTSGRLGAREARDLALAGAFLAVHFAAWIASLERTSVVRSVTLVSTAPLWTALLSAPVLRERVPRAAWAGLGLALAGVAAMAAGARGSGDVPRSLGGDGLALLGAWAMSGYLLAGRGLRARVPFLPYVASVYGVAALLLLVTAGAAGALAVDLPPRAWGWIALLALVPQLVGHTALNWSVRRLPAAFVAVALLGEPVGAAALAFAILGEAPTVREAAGAMLVLAGIALSARMPAPPGQPGPRPGL